MSMESPLNALENADIKLPPLQGTLVRAIEIMQQPGSAPFEDVVGLVEHDPGVASRLLRMANSPYFGLRHPITSIHRMVTILGAGPVLGIVMNLSLRQAQLTGRAHTASKQLISHSVATAFLARHLLAHDPASNTVEDHRGRDVFTASLLHDIGKLVLLYNKPAVAVPFYQASALTVHSDAEVLEQERTLFGYDHVEAGVYLAKELQFPELLTAAIARHHSYDRLSTEDAAIKGVVFLVAAASKAANMLGYTLNRADTSETSHADPWGLLLKEQVLTYPSVEALLAKVVAAEDELAAYIQAVS